MNTGRALMILTAPVIAVWGMGGCATHGDLVSLREEMHKEMALSRTHLNERIDQAADQLDARKKAVHEQTQQTLAEVKARMQQLAAIEARLKDLHAAGERQQKALDEVRQQLATVVSTQAAVKELQGQLEASRQTVQDVKHRLDAMQKDRARLQVLLHTLEDNVIRSFKAEQVGMRDRLKALDQSVRDLEHRGSLQTAPNAPSTNQTN